MEDDQDSPIMNCSRDILQLICIFLEGTDIINFGLSCKKILLQVDQEDVWRRMCMKEAITIERRFDQTWKETFIEFTQGDLFGWGCGKKGVFGIPTMLNINFPTKLEFPENFGTLKLFDCEGQNSWFINSQNILFSNSGPKKNGIFSDRKIQKLEKPNEFLKNFLGNINEISCGENNLGIRIENLEFGKNFGVWSWSPRFGKWFSHDFQEKISKVSVGKTVVGFLDENGSLWFAGSEMVGTHKLDNDILQKIEIPNGEKIKDFEMGESQIICSGEQNVFTYILPMKEGNWTKISERKNWMNTGEILEQLAVGYCSFAVRTNKFHVWTWGNNGNGVLGSPHFPSKVNIPQPILSRFQIVKIAIGGYHLHCLTNKGENWVCGFNGAGQGAVNHFNTLTEFQKSEIEFKIIDIKASGFFTLGKVVFPKSFLKKRKKEEPLMLKPKIIYNLKYSDIDYPPQPLEIQEHIFYWKDFE